MHCSLNYWVTWWLVFVLTIVHWVRFDSHNSKFQSHILNLNDNETVHNTKILGLLGKVLFYTSECIKGPWKFHWYLVNLKGWENQWPNCSLRFLIIEKKKIKFLFFKQKCSICRKITKLHFYILLKIL